MEEPIAGTSNVDSEREDSNSYSEFHDAENTIFHDENDDPEENKHSIIQVIQHELITQNESLKPNDVINKSESFCSEKSKDLDGSQDKLDTLDDQEDDNTDDYMHDKTWLLQKKHVFVLSEAGKPIYSLHGVEDKLSALFGLIQALISFVQHGQDAITSIHADGIKFVFIVRNSLILVGATRSKLSVHQIQLQLSDVYNQILSTLTYSHLTKIFEKRKNFDLRRLLAGTERLIDHLLINDSSNKKITNNVFTSLTNSIRVMPLSTSTRSSITNAIQNNCSKIQNLVFAILIANNKLISLVRMKKYSVHPADLRLIFNLIESSESFKASENWTPICLPKFDMNGYLHAHVSYLADDCQACLLLLSVDRDVFFTLSEAKKKITEKLRRTHCLEAINDEIKSRGLNLDAIGIPELRHFLYKPKGLSQLLCSEISPPYTTLSEFERLEGIYSDIYDRVHNLNRPLKLIYEVKEREVVLAWVTSGYEIYSVFEPTVDKCLVITLINKLMKWIEKEYDVLFIKVHPNF